jgi:hypothetical protein
MHSGGGRKILVLSWAIALFATTKRREPIRFCAALGSSIEEKAAIVSLLFQNLRA